MSASEPTQRRELSSSTVSPGRAGEFSRSSWRRVNWRALGLILAGIGATSAGHYLTPPRFLLWHEIFQRLYYLPVVFAAIAFGWKGGVAAALLSGVSYIPHIVVTWSGMEHYAMGQYAEILMFLAVGTVTGVLADREQRRRLELQQTADQLSGVYRELQNTFEQVKRADRLSAIGQLAAGLAHEIRNPLASIDGAAEVLQAGAEADVKSETLRIIRQECARLNRLLTSLLDFARPRRPEWREVNVREVLDAVVELVSHSARTGIRFDPSSPENLPRLWCDQEQVAQVIMNLAINAAQAMPQGGTVRLEAREHQGGVLIEVSDDGTGVPPEHFDRIFDPFFTTKEGGTGLGLSVVHQIVGQHGGTVAARRNPGRGMTFTVFFPQTAGLQA